MLLRQLFLCNNGLNKNSMHEMFNVLCSGQVNIIDKGLNINASTICKRLTKIHFFNNMRSYGGCQTFARILYHCFANLEDARFSGTRAGC